MRSLAKDRRAARELALDVLYQAEIRGKLPTEVLALQREAGWSPAGEDDSHAAPPPGEVVSYAAILVNGVQENSAAIDLRIARYADRWALERMPIIDRSLLRLALFELLWVPDVPVPVVINEAVEMAKTLSTEDSGRFINGMLGRIADEASRT